MPTTEKTQPAGSRSGAMHYLQTFMIDGKIDMTPFGSTGKMITRKDSPYSIVLQPPVQHTVGSGSNAGIGTVSYGSHKLWFNFDSDGTISNLKLDKRPAPHSFLDELVGGLVGAPDSDEYDNVQKFGNAANQAYDSVTSVAQFLSNLSDPALWKRIGIGAAGIGIVVVALIIWIAHKGL